MTEQQQINPFETLNLIAERYITVESWQERTNEVRVRYLSYMQERFPSQQYLIELCQSGLATRIARWFNDCMEYLHLNHFNDWKGLRIINRIDSELQVRQQELKKLEKEKERYNG